LSAVPAVGNDPRMCVVLLNFVVFSRFIFIKVAGRKAHFGSFVILQMGTSIHIMAIRNKL